jgi:hypothetical protein
MAPNNQSYVVDASSNLVRWVPVTTNSATNGWFIFVNTNATAPYQFYRVQQ